MGNWRPTNLHVNLPTKRMGTGKTSELPLEFLVVYAKYEDLGQAFRIVMENHDLNRRRLNYCDPKI